MVVVKKLRIFAYISVHLILWDGHFYIPQTNRKTPSQRLSPSPSPYIYYKYTITHTTHNEITLTKTKYRASVSAVTKWSCQIEHRGGRRRNSSRELRSTWADESELLAQPCQNGLLIQFCRIFGQPGNNRSLCHRYGYRIYFLIKTITFCRKFTYLL